MSLPRTPTAPVQLLTAGQTADVEHACKILGIDPNKKISEWRIDSMSMNKRDTDLFIHDELEKLIREAQAKEKESGGAAATGPNGPSSGTREKRKSYPQDLLTRLKGIIREVDQSVAGNLLECAETALTRAEAVLSDLDNILDKNVKDQLMTADKAHEVGVEAARLMKVPREAVDLLRKRVAAREYDEYEAFVDAQDEDPKGKKESTKRDDSRANMENVKMQLQSLRDNCELAIREAARSSEAVNKERQLIIYAKADALKKAALSAAAWSSKQRKEADWIIGVADELVDEVSEN